jgi:gamma-glutamylcyclotransferase (GGCT)/AIG2-like uncharacterized protein YtfP
MIMGHLLSDHDANVGAPIISAQPSDTWAVGVAYFAYGTNMAESVIAEFCPGHRLLGVAELPDHRLAFTRRSIRTGTGVADAVPAPGHQLWGVLYELSESDLATLDRKEGNGWAYQREAVAVRPVTTRAATWAVLYRVREPEDAEVAPSPEYLELLLDAAGSRGLPTVYVSELEAVAAAFSSPGRQAG